MNAKLFDAPVQVSIKRQIECADRESAMRLRVYEWRVQNGKMTAKTADEEKASMRAIAITLRRVEKFERAGGVLPEWEG